MSIAAGVSNCYVFKSRLQEYAQKANLMTPVYETIKEGPSHQPCFRSTVIVDNVRYDSLPGFFNRKAAEQSAAEVALLELAKLGRLHESNFYPVNESGLCKNLLQEYAQKMNFALPTYTCRPVDTFGKRVSYSCTVEIGGISYIGAYANSKKEAEVKAARTALLAIQSITNTNGAGQTATDNPQLTVLPTPKMSESDTKNEETEKSLKPRKASKKRWQRKKYLQKRVERTVEKVEGFLRNQVVPAELPEADNGSHIGEHVVSHPNNNQPACAAELSNTPQVGQTVASNINPSDHEFNVGDFSRGQANDLGTPEAGVNKVAGAEQVAQISAVVRPQLLGDYFVPGDSLIGLFN